MRSQENKRHELFSLHYNLLALWPIAIEWIILLKNWLKVLQSKKKTEVYTLILLMFGLCAAKFKQTKWNLKRIEFNTQEKSNDSIALGVKLQIIIFNISVEVSRNWTTLPFISRNFPFCLNTYSFSLNKANSL